MKQPTEAFNAGITGYSCVTHLGAEDHLWRACRDNVRFFQEGLGVIDESITQQCHQWIKENRTWDKELELLQRSSLLKWTLYAVAQSMEKAGWDKLNKDDGLILATTTGLIEIWEDNLLDFFKDQQKREIYRSIGSFQETVRKALKHEGPHMLISSACSASTQALGIAHLWLKTGRVKRCLVVGGEKLCQLTSLGFGSLSLLSPEPCKPFNKSHSGINLSEAAGAICIENKNAAGISGYASFSDGHSMTSPKPDGSGPFLAMSRALQQAQVGSEDLSWVHAHGTGSLQNDQAESKAIHRLGVHCSTSSTKAIHGHALGASGLIESILCVKALTEHEVLPSWGGEIGDYEIQLTDTDARSPLRHILKNTLGFGGINASLVFSQGGH